MRVTIKDRDALNECYPDLIKSYLIKKGWVKDQSAFSFENNTIYLPDIVDKNYFGQVSYILMLLERIENRSQLDIWCEITNKTLCFGKDLEEQKLDSNNVSETESHTVDDLLFQSLLSIND